MCYEYWHCRAYLEAEVDIDDPERPVYLLGESFGAVLALAVAHAKTDLVDRLVLVNPATSYEQSIWPRLGPALANLPDVSFRIFSGAPVAARSIFDVQDVTSHQISVSNQAGRLSRVCSQ